MPAHITFHTLGHVQGLHPGGGDDEGGQNGPPLGGGG